MKLNKNNCNNVPLNLLNTQDVLYLAKLIVPNKFRFFEVDKIKKSFVIKTKQMTRSGYIYYIVINPSMYQVQKFKKNFENKLLEELEINLTQIDFNFNVEVESGISSIKQIGNYYMLMFGFKANYYEQIAIKKIYYNLN